MSYIKNSEKETHINMERESEFMQVYTTEKSVMRKLDRYVEESDDWKLVEVGKCKGEIISKTYEAPKNLLALRKQKRVMSDEQRQAAAERFKAYHAQKHHKDDDENEIDNIDDSSTEILDDYSDEDSTFQPELNIFADDERGGQGYL